MNVSTDLAGVTAELLLLTADFISIGQFYTYRRTLGRLQTFASRESGTMAERARLRKLHCRFHVGTRQNKARSNVVKRGYISMLICSDLRAVNRVGTLTRNS